MAIYICTTQKTCSVISPSRNCLKLARVIINFLKSLMPWKNFHKLLFSRICIARTAAVQSGKR